MIIMEEVLNINMSDDKIVGTGEIVIYQPDEVTRLEVKVENETVWLNPCKWRCCLVEM